MIIMTEFINIIDKLNALNIKEEFSSYPDLIIPKVYDFSSDKIIIMSYIEKYKDFKDFQVVMVLPDGTQNQVEELLKIDIKKLGTHKGWKFVFASPNQIFTF